MLLMCVYKVLVSPWFGPLLYLLSIALWATSDQPISRPPTLSLLLSCFCGCGWHKFVLWLRLNNVTHSDSDA